MKKNNFKSLQLKKKSIAKITSNHLNGGGIWTTTTTSLTTIGDITKSCPSVCGSVQ